MKNAFLLSVLLFGCLFGEAQPIYIDLQKALTNDHEVRLSESAQSVKYIKLETSADCLIGHTNKLYMHKNHLVVAHQKILQYDTLGNFVRVLANRGKGPGEFIEFAGIDIDVENDHLFLFDRGTGNTLEFDLNEGFVDELSVHPGMKGLKLAEDQFACFYPTRFIMLAKYHNLQIKNRKGKVIKNLREQEKFNNSNLVQMPVQNYDFWRHKDSLTFWDGFNDTIFRLTPDYKVTPAYILDLGKQKVPNKLKAGQGSPQYWDEINRYSYISSMIESDKYLFMFCSHKGKARTVIYNKRTGEAYSMDQSISIINDYDGGYFYWPHGINHQGQLYVIMNMTRLKDHFAKKPNQEITNKQAYETLKKLVRESDENDNPIVMVVTLKDI